MGGGRLGVKNCGRWEIGGQKLWEVGDGHPCVTPPYVVHECVTREHYKRTVALKGQVEK